MIMERSGASPKMAPTLRRRYHSFKDPMNIEERLEAVTHTLELVALMQRDSEKRIDRLADALEQTNIAVQNISDVLTTFNRAMAATVVNHEDRIRRLESNGA